MNEVEAIRWRVQCYICGGQFSWEGDSAQRVPPSQHKTCKRRILRKRASGELMLAPCPRPEKRIFSTSDEAKAFIDVAHRGELMSPYRCRCGGIHIGHLIAVCEAKKVDGVWTVSSERKVQGKLRQRVEKKRYPRLPLAA